MKKTLGLLALISIVGFTIAQQKQQEEKRYTISLTLQQAETLLYCIDKSNAEHTIVEGTKAFIVTQINAQLKSDTAKHK